MTAITRDATLDTVPMDWLDTRDLSWFFIMARIGREHAAQRRAYRQAAAARRPRVRVARIGAHITISRCAVTHTGRPCPAGVCTFGVSP